ncbi:coiled-coil domain-containing protein 117 [Pseudonaja textilis]|uniref:coiled-coil domain-containing protein 117 n=1 Tax=Pseudonaja textilis TaxID=8673 RepID=UPI000EA9B684|nr:coiled-coil domain-containing protein 117 [Pseudonaja textilis]
MASGPLPSSCPPPLAPRPRARRLAALGPARPPVGVRGSSVSPTSAPLRAWRKHRMEEEPEGCPPGKKAAAAGWLCCAGAPPGPPEVPCEEMEQVGPEQQCEAARRRLQEIEDRITEEEEEEEEEEGLAGRPEGHLPILVLSHTLQTGLKQDYEGNLTKKIIESMSRPSMELVLWKPLPEFLPEKGGPVSIKGYKPLVTEIRLGKLAALEAAFPSQTDKFLTQSQQAEMPLAQFGAGGSNGPAEEEMEL